MGRWKKIGKPPKKTAPSKNDLFLDNDEGKVKAFVGPAWAAHTHRWNAVVPSRAVLVEDSPGGIRYLHPTKGWRRVSNRRLGL